MPSKSASARREKRKLATASATSEPPRRIGSLPKSSDYVNVFPGRHTRLERIAKQNAGQNDDGACFRRWIAQASVVGHRESRNEYAGRRVRHIAGRSHIARPGVAARE